MGIIALAAIPVAFLLALLITLTCFLCSDELGFTLVIKGAPTAARVFVDEIEFPSARENGDIKLRYLKSNVAHRLRVSHENYENFVFTATGEDGEVKEFTVRLEPAQNANSKGEP